jgi:hypothetical protein
MNCVFIAVSTVCPDFFGVLHFITFYFWTKPVSIISTVPLFTRTLAFREGSVTTSSLLNLYVFPSIPSNSSISFLTLTTVYSDPFSSIPSFIGSVLKTQFLNLVMMAVISLKRFFSLSIKFSKPSTPLSVLQT